jgi:hypothetical protein
MSLPETPPDPPTVYDGHDDEYHDDVERRAAIQRFFEGENAWGEAYDQWLEGTLLTEREYDVATELGLFGRLDFFWDSESERVTYEAPSNLDAADDVSLDVASDIEEELDEFAQIVADTLTDYYIDWEPTDEADSDYHRIFGDQYNAADDVLTDEDEAGDGA